MAEPASQLLIKNSPGSYAGRPSRYSWLSTKSTRRSIRQTHPTFTALASAMSSLSLQNMVEASPNYWTRLQFQYQHLKRLKGTLMARFALPSSGGRTWVSPRCSTDLWARSVRWSLRLPGRLEMRLTASSNVLNSLSDLLTLRVFGEKVRQNLRRKNLAS